jgi:hypothetical protein
MYKDLSSLYLIKHHDKSISLFHEVIEKSRELSADIA